MEIGNGNMSACVKRCLEAGCLEAGAGCESPQGESSGPKLGGNVQVCSHSSFFTDSEIDWEAKDEPEQELRWAQ